MSYQEGRVYTVRYPFIKRPVTLYDEEGCAQAWTWVPGTRRREEPYHWDEHVADGMGQQRLTVVGTYKPGSKYRERVFYTQLWTDPDGKVFGNTKLRICSAQKFASLIMGYRYTYEVINNGTYLP